jgi:hypothetical protein
MDSITLWARNGEAVRQAIELGELVHMETANEAFTDALLLFAIESGVSKKWAEAFPDPREEPEMGMEGMLPAHMAGRFAGLYSFRKTGYVLRSARVLGALGSRVAVIEPAHGLSVRGTSDATLFHGDVVRKLLVKMAQHVAPTSSLRLPAHEPKVSVNVRQRASRRAVKGGVDAVEAEARAQRVAAKLMAWYNAHVGPSLLEYARVGTGRRIHILDTTGVEVPLATGTYECSGVVHHDDGSRSRGDTWATLRTVLDHAGLITQVGLCPIQVHDVPVCGPLLETAPVVRAGDLLLEDRAVIDGDTITFLKQQRHVDVIVPLKSTMLSSKEAVDLATMHDQWQPHPSRDHQQMTFVKGVEHVWDACQVSLNACVMRDWNRKKEALDHSVLVTTDQRLDGTWMVRHDEERPEIAHDDAQMKSGGWPLKKRSATRYSEMVLYMLTVVLSYSLYHLFANTQAGARFADTTREALAFDQLRSRRTHVIVYAGGSFEIFETLSFARCILQLPASAQDRLRHWLDEHLHPVIQRE